MALAPITNVPDDVKAAGEAVIKGWMDGSYNVYAGPIKDQSGAVKVAEGSSLSAGRTSSASTGWWTVSTARSAKLS